MLGIAGMPSDAQLSRPDNARLRSRWRREANRATAQTSPAAHRQLGRPTTQNVTWSQCRPEADNFGASCGYVSVPLDRRHPYGQQVGIYFEQYEHSNPGAAQSAIILNFGGPGSGTTTNRDLALSLFAPNLDAHDLLLVDDRGRGSRTPLIVKNCSMAPHRPCSTK
jgi:hypothetical protein